MGEVIEFKSRKTLYSIYDPQTRMLIVSTSDFYVVEHYWNKDYLITRSSSVAIIDVLLSYSSELWEPERYSKILHFPLKIVPSLAERIDRL